MKSRPPGLDAWLDRRRRKWLAWWRGRWRRIPAVRGTIALLCDCEGHYGGPEGERFADTGLNSLLDLLSRDRLRITFSVVADLCRTHTERVRRIADAGHELAAHGWQHERPRDLTESELDAMLGQAQGCFAALDLKATGFRSPQSAWSWRLIEHLPRHGFAWSAERDPARQPYRLTDRVIRVPVLVDDWDLAEGQTSPAGLMARWREIVGHAVARDRVVAVGVHEWLFGREADYAGELAEHLTWLRTHLEMKIVTVGELAGLSSGRPVRGV
jgi:peptidoglycan/xylan/chitin deacetylase (PgdA/CDA1 family)